MVCVVSGNLSSGDVPDADPSSDTAKADFANGISARLPSVLGPVADWLLLSGKQF